MNKLAEVDTQTPKVDYLLDFAVIGAGIAGLTAASEINQLGYTLAVFEKARGTGGRLSSKRVAKPNGEFMAFDLGCVSITAESDAFAEQLAVWYSNGVIEPWGKDDQDNDHYVAVPRNSALTRYLSKDLECHFSTRVTAIENVDGIWHLFTEENTEKSQGRMLLAKAKNVIIATPPPQAQDLLPGGNAFKDQLDKVEVSPQWVMAVEVEQISSLPAIQYPQNDIIFSISQEDYKPGRSHGESRGDDHGSTILQVQATPEWTNNHLELNSDQVCNILIHELERHFEQSLSVVTRYAHRWLYSCVVQDIRARESYLWDEKGLGLIGDYIKSADADEGDGVESAWQSGKQLAQWITSHDSVEHS
jgi:renalase